MQLRIGGGAGEDAHDYVDLTFLPSSPNPARAANACKDIFVKIMTHNLWHNTQYITQKP